MAATWASEALPSASNWFTDQDTFTSQQTQVHTEEAKRSNQVLQALLDGKVDSKAAAQDIAAACKEQIVERGDNMTPEGVWKAFCGAVECFAHESEPFDRLILLLVELAAIDVLDDRGARFSSSVNADAFWRQLPGFSLMFRDGFSTSIQSVGAFSKGTSRYSEAKRRLHNGNLFQAKWLCQVGRNGPAREYESALTTALWQLRAALEVRTETSPVGVRRVELYVPGTAPWILEAGDIIFRLCKDNVRNEGQKVVEPPFWDDGVCGYGYVGSDGFNLERWAFWKASLQQTAQLQGVEADVLEAAGKALARMEEAEKVAWALHDYTLVLPVN